MASVLGLSSISLGQTATHNKVFKPGLNQVAIARHATKKVTDAIAAGRQVAAKRKCLDVAPKDKEALPNLESRKMRTDGHTADYSQAKCWTQRAAACA